MADQWFIMRDDKGYGPYTSAQMREFAFSGKLLPIDMVSETGSEPWLPASQVETIFPASVPSSPALPPARQAESVPPDKASATAADLLWRLWANKLLFFSVCLGIWILVGTCINLINHRLFELVPLLMVPYPVLLITVIVLGVRQLKANEERKKRRAHLHGLWEPVDREGQSFLFTKDGGMYRSDGFGAKYRWAADGKLELYEDGCEPTVQFALLSLSELEMILKTGGQSCHFRRCDTISEAEMARRREAAFRMLGNVVGGVSKVALGAAAVLAAGGFAVLCGAGALAAAGSSGPPVGSGNMVACSICCQTGMMPNGPCPKCGGKGWLLA
jgi:hypothetical protein